jgi:hypothetical protein
MAHRAIAINEWRGKISPSTSHACPTCTSGATESVIHRFWSCPHALRTWQFTSDILGLLTSNLPEVEWRHALFGETIQSNSQAILRHWVLLCGLTLWNIWLMRNHMVFQRVQWNHGKVTQLIWQGFIDYGRADWAKVLATIAKSPNSTKKVLRRFDSQWGQFPWLCFCVNMQVHWHRHNPLKGIG